MRLRHALTACLLLVLSAGSHAAVLLYTGSLVQRTHGGGTSSVERLNLILIVDTELVDPFSQKPNATLFVYLTRAGGGYIPLAIHELDDRYDTFLLAEVTGGAGTRLSLTGQNPVDEESDLFSNLHLSGNQVTVNLYRNEEQQVVQAAVPLTLEGTGVERYFDTENQPRLRESTYSFRIHGMTLSLNTGSPEDFDNAVETINLLLIGSPSNPSTN